MKDARHLVMNKTAGASGLGQGCNKGGGKAGDQYMGKGSKGNKSYSPRIDHKY